MAKEHQFYYRSFASAKRLVDAFDEYKVPHIAIESGINIVDEGYNYLVTAWDLDDDEDGIVKHLAD